MKDVGKFSIAMTAFCAGAAMALAAVHDATKESIAEQQRLKTIRSLKAVLPPFDNEIDKEVKEIVTGKDVKGKDITTTFYLAKAGGQFVGAAFQMVAPDGYNGNITFLMGVDADRKVSGVEIVAHTETPGLGDGMLKKAWRDEFKGKTLVSRLDVKKDGGEIDQFTGATITPRAVVKAVKKGLELYHKEFADGRS